MELNLHIAGIFLSITSDSGIRPMLSNRHKHFTQQGISHILEPENLHIHYCHRIPEPTTGPLKVISGGVHPYQWKIFKYSDQSIFYLFYPEQMNPTLIQLKHRDLSKPVLIQSPEEEPEALRYPADLMLFQMLGNHFKSILVHACGFSFNNTGVIALGHSGTGKSTLTQLARDSGATIIQDDRLLIREEMGSWWMYSTPISPTDHYRKTKISHMLVLHHGSINSLRTIQPAQRSDRFLPHLAHIPAIPESYFYQLYLSDELIRNTPFYDLYFLPNPSVMRHLAEKLAFKRLDHSTAQIRTFR